MDNSPLYSEALQKIGRNVVTLQKLEGLLKELLVVMELDGEVCELKDLEIERRTSISKRTMGTVCGELFDKIFSEPSEPVRKTDTGAPWISFQYRRDGSDDYIEGIKNSFKKIVEERNQLIHHRLQRFDETSDDSCRQLISCLDAQHERVTPFQKILTGELKDIKKSRAILSQLLIQLSLHRGQGESE